MSLWLFVLSLLTLCACQSDFDTPPDRKGWVDPDDMGMPFDPTLRSTAEMIKTLKKQNVENNVKASSRPPDSSMPNLFAKVSSCAQTETLLEDCKRTVKFLENQIHQGGHAQEHGLVPTPPVCPDETPADIFLKRQVQYIIRLFKVDEEEEEVEFDVQVGLKGSEVKVLMDFVNGRERGHVKMDAILTDMFRSVKRKISEEQMDVYSKMDYTSWLRRYLPSNEDLFWIIAISAISIFVYLAWIGVPIWKLSMLLLGISSAIHWTHLYKKALTSKHSKLMQNRQIPPECSPNEMTWSQLIFYSLSTKDNCKDYHEALLIDPFWEVSPTMAIAETITKFILLPLEHIGLHLGRFFSALLGELSWFSSSFVLVFVFIAIFLLLIMVFGYRFRMPFFLGALEPKSSTPVPSIKEIRDLNDKIELLQLSLQKSEQGAIGMQQSSVDSGRVEEITLARGRSHDNSLRRRLLFNSPKPRKCNSTSNCQSCQKEPKPSIVRTNSSPTLTEVDKNDEELEYEELVMEELSPHVSLNDSLLKTPKKKLVVKGSVTSPGETVFEWVPIEDDEDPTEVDDYNAEIKKAHLEKDANSSVFLDQIQSVFHEDLQE